MKCPSLVFVFRKKKLDFHDELHVHRLGDVLSKKNRRTFPLLDEPLKKYLPHPDEIERRMLLLKEHLDIGLLMKDCLTEMRLKK